MYKFVRNLAPIRILMHKTLIYLILPLLLINCNTGTEQTAADKRITRTQVTATPIFNADTAYSYVAKQVSFGPRVPGTDAHALAASWLVEKLNGFADTVIVQSFRVRLYTKAGMDGHNIIASFNPGAEKRVLLAAHWDTRPYADHDPDPAFHRTPIDGANDGGSGVGVLLELARLLNNNPVDPKLGIDIILFDLEDYGPHNEQRTFRDEDFWALGSQYWARNQHRPSYRARYGILLDMVGAADAFFPREYYSQQYAPWVLDKVWQTASRLGYSHAFSNSPGPPINDDHVPVNRYAGIPMINIIHIDTGSSNGSFFEYWHTMKDNMDHIDIETLRMVGKVITTVIYEEQ